MLADFVRAASVTDAGGIAEDEDEEATGVLLDEAAAATADEDRDAAPN